MSSRNAYLRVEERKAAPSVYKSLVAGETVWKEGGEGGVRADAIVDAVREILEGEPMINEVQYVSLDDNRTMEKVEFAGGKDELCLSVAVKCGEVRLIDNIVLGVER